MGNVIEVPVVKTIITSDDPVPRLVGPGRVKSHGSKEPERRGGGRRPRTTRTKTPRRRRAHVAWPEDVSAFRFESGQLDLTGQLSNLPKKLRDLLVPD